MFLVGQYAPTDELMMYPFVSRDALEFNRKCADICIKHKQVCVGVGVGGCVGVGVPLWVCGCVWWCVVVCMCTKIFPLAFSYILGGSDQSSNGGWLCHWSDFI